MTRPRKWTDGTRWAMLGLPVAVADKIEQRYGALPDGLIRCLRELMADLPWPEEDGGPPPTAPDGES